MQTFGIWMIMVITVLLVPFAMIGFGKYMLGSGSEEVSDWIGYRTNFSRKNKDTWKFAQKYYGRLIYKPGIVMILASILAMIFVFGKESQTIAIIGCALEVIQVIYMLGAVIPTERALRKTFDKNGERLN